MTSSVLIVAKEETVCSLGGQDSGWLDEGLRLLPCGLGSRGVGLRGNTEFLLRVSGF